MYTHFATITNISGKTVRNDVLRLEHIPISIYTSLSSRKYTLQRLKFARRVYTFACGVCHHQTRIPTTIAFFEQWFTRSYTFSVLAAYKLLT